jgi:hypothetical protein
MAASLDIKKARGFAAALAAASARAFLIIF